MTDNKIQSFANITNNVLEAIGNVSNASVSRFIGKTQIVSRVYISSTLEHNEHMPDILNFTHNMYMAALLNAMNLTRFVDGARTVSDLIRPIATESFVSRLEWRGNGIGLENAIGFDAISDILASVGKENIDVVRSPHPGSAAAGVKPIGATTSKDSIKDAPLLPQGKTLTVWFAPVGKDGMVSATGAADINEEVPVDDKKAKPPEEKTDDRRFSVDITVRLSPFTIPNSLIDAFMAFNYTPTISQRWIQWRTGEIRFWRDFMFAQDIVNQRSKIFRLDKTGTLSSYLERMQLKKAGIINRVCRALINTNRAGESTLNVANTVLVFTKQDVERYRSITGHDLWGNPYHRNLFLHNCMAMFIIIIDPILNKVLFGINTYGVIGAESTYGTYNITDFASKKNKSDMEHVTGLIKDLMAGRMPAL